MAAQPVVVGFILLITQSIVLSYTQVAPLFDARQTGAAIATVSLDLGLSHCSVAIQDAGVFFPNGQWLAWPTLAEIAENHTACFAVVEENQLEKIQRFSPEFNRLYSLMPTTGAPTMLISGIPMHRIKETEPQRDTHAKIRAVGPLSGVVLDTATGLGYTAIAAAHHANHVTTIELDPTVLDICRANPWSRELFDHPKITQLIGDSFDVVEEIDDKQFDYIIHDPPMFSLAGHLYSAEFYRHLWRVLRPRGKLFHYVGNPESKSGRSVTRGVVERLQSAGFMQIQRRPAAFGVVAIKPKS